MIFVVLKKRMMDAYNFICLNKKIIKRFNKSLRHAHNTQMCETCGVWQKYKYCYNCYSGQTSGHYYENTLEETIRGMAKYKKFNLIIKMSIRYPDQKLWIYLDPGKSQQLKYILRFRVLFSYEMYGEYALSRSTIKKMLSVYNNKKKIERIAYPAILSAPHVVGGKLLRINTVHKYFPGTICRIDSSNMMCLEDMYTTKKVCPNVRTYVDDVFEFLERVMCRDCVEIILVYYRTTILI